MKRLLLTVLAATLAVSLAATSVVALAHQVVHRRPYLKDGLLTILVIGSDTGPPHRPTNPMRGRADGVHLIVVDSQTKRATIVDFPRDGLVAGRKVNGHLAIGGPARLEGALESYTGLDIDFWVLSTFRSVENVVDGLGGVDITIDQPMKDPFSGSDFAAGTQKLAGWQALAFVRDRKSVPGGDFGRTRNQGALLRAAHRQIHQRSSSLPDLVQLVGLFARNVVTNIPKTELLQLAILAVEISPDQVRQVALGGTAGMKSGASVVNLAPGDLFTQLRNGAVGP